MLYISHNTNTNKVRLFVSILNRTKIGGEKKNCRQGANLVGVLGEVLSAGHHQGGSLLQLPQPLAPLVQSDASTRQLAHRSAGRYLHALHPSLAWDVLGQTPGGLPGRCLANCGSITQSQRRGREAVKFKARRPLQMMTCTVFNWD